MAAKRPAADSAGLPRKKRASNNFAMSPGWSGGDISDSLTVQRVCEMIGEKYSEGKNLHGVSVLSCFASLSPFPGLQGIPGVNVKEVAISDPHGLYTYLAEPCASKMEHVFKSAAPGAWCRKHDAQCAKGKIDLLAADFLGFSTHKIDLKAFILASEPRAVVVLERGALSAAQIREVKDALPPQYNTVSVSSIRIGDVGLPQHGSVTALVAKINDPVVVRLRLAQVVHEKNLLAKVSVALAAGWQAMEDDGNYQGRKDTGKKTDDASIEQARQSLVEMELIPEDCAITEDCKMIALDAVGVAKVAALRYWMDKKGASSGFVDTNKKAGHVHIDGTFQFDTVGQKPLVVSDVKDRQVNIRRLMPPHVLALNGYEPGDYNLAIRMRPSAYAAACKMIPLPIAYAVCNAALAK